MKDANFPSNPKLAIKKGFELAEKNFLEYAQGKRDGIFEKSGSCAIVVLIIGMFFSQKPDFIHFYR